MQPVIIEDSIKSQHLFEKMSQISLFSKNKYFIVNNKMFMLMNIYIKLDIHNKIKMVDNVIYTHKNLFYVVVDKEYNDEIMSCTLDELKLYSRNKKLRKIMNNIKNS